MKITVIKHFTTEDVFGPEHNQRTLSVTPITKCSRVTEGDEYHVTDINTMPEGFCGWAWRDIKEYIAVLMHGGASTLGSLKTR